MLSTLEMVSEPSGKTKTLYDLIKEICKITPETPVHTSDDSIELEEYIESLIPPSPGSFTTALLFEAETTTAGNITLSDDYDKYDMLYFDLYRHADDVDYHTPEMFLSQTLALNDYLQFIESTGYVSYKITGKTALTLINGGYPLYIKRIVGIKF